MMKTYRLISRLMAAVLLSCCFFACSGEDEEVFENNKDKDKDKTVVNLNSKIVPISGATDQGLQSTQIVEGQKVGVTITGAASVHKNVAWTVGKNGSLSNTGTAAYWGTTNVTVTAYHPYHSTYTGTNQTFTVNTDQSKEEGYLNSDLLWATTTASSAANPVTLNFSHKLSQINVTLVNDGNIDLSGASITLCGTNIATGFNPQTGELHAVTESIADIKAYVTSGSTCTASVMIVPQTLKEGSEFIKISVGEEDYHYTLPEDRVFESGKAYEFTIEVNISDDSDAHTDYVDLKFDMSGVTTSYNSADGSLTMTYPSGSIPRVKEGKAIVLPENYGFEIRVIESVTTSGNTLSMKTSKGNMGNLFRNTSFTLTTDAEVASRSANTNVYTPVAYGYVDENGTYHEMYNASRAAYPIEQFKWEFKKDYNGEKLYDGKAGTLSWDKCEFNAGLKGTFTFDFGEKTIDEVRAIGDLKRLDYKLTGNVDVDMLLHYNFKYEYNTSGDEIIKYNAIPMIQITFRPVIAGVPVPVHLQVYTHLGKMYACQIEGEVDATAGVKMGNQMTVGLEWTPEGGANLIREMNPYLEFYPLTVEAQASAEAKVSYYPQWEVGIYGFKAVWLEPRPYLKEWVEAGFRASTDGRNYIGWKAETYNGMDLCVGLETEFGFWRKDIWTSDIYNVVKDRLLFEAPSRITTLSPENNIEVEKGESVDAEFMVESFSPITNKYYPCPWALVNFEPECGELDKPLAMSDLEGKATVTWTPSPTAESRSSELEECTLTAKVVNKEGTSIDEATLVIRTEEENDDEFREALIKLYNSTNGDNWSNNTNWCSDKPVHEWYGVSKDGNGEYSIDLSKNHLTGIIDQKFPDCVISLNCYHNLLTSLNVSGCTALEELVCKYNQLTSLNVSGCTALEELNCEVNQLTSLDVSTCTALEKLISYDNPLLTSLNVTGCTALKELWCRGNPLTSLDVSGCTALEELDCGGDQLTSLDVSGCTALKRLECIGFPLTSLNASGCTALEELKCDENQLTFLNVFGCTALKRLECENNKLTSLDASGCTALEELDCEFNQLTSLNVSGCQALYLLKFQRNPLEILDISKCTLLKSLDFLSYTSSLKVIGNSFEEINVVAIYQLKSLDVSGCTSLKKIYCGGNGLTELIVSGCTSLHELNCENNQLTSLNVSGCTSLYGLSCENNQLTSLNVSGCTSLYGLNCNNNQLTSLDVSGCTSLESLKCNNNQLTSLDVSGCTSLYELECTNSQLTSLNAVNCHINLLHIEGLITNSLTVYGGDFIEEVTIKGSKLHSLDLSMCKALAFFTCENSSLEYLDLTNCDIDPIGYGFQISELMNSSLKVKGNHIKLMRIAKSCLKSLNVSECKDLEAIEITDNTTSSLEFVGKNTDFDLYANNNEFTSLDFKGRNIRIRDHKSSTLKVTGNSLVSLSVDNQQLKSLDVSGCTSLEYLYCNGNQLEDLNLLKCTSLKGLSCQGNQLTEVDVSDCKELKILKCYNNRITREIPNWFSKLDEFKHDVRYRYWTEKDSKGNKITKHEDRGVGWWYPGEPGKGKHSRD